jgi:hypothetical protein
VLGNSLIEKVIKGKGKAQQLARHGILVVSLSLGVVFTGFLVFASRVAVSLSAVSEYSVAKKAQEVTGFFFSDYFFYRIFC